MEHNADIFLMPICS